MEYSYTIVQCTRLYLFIDVNNGIPVQYTGLLTFSLEHQFSIYQNPFILWYQSQVPHNLLVSGLAWISVPSEPNGVHGRHREPVSDGSFNVLVMQMPAPTTVATERIRREL